MSFYESTDAMNKRHFILALFDERKLPWIICGLGAMFYCYEYYLRISPSVMTGDLMRTYNLNAGQLGNLIAFYYYAYTPMQLFVGVLMDHYGPRRLLTLACMCCSVGALLFAYQYSLFLAEFGRFMVGFGSAFAFVGTLKLATMWLPPERFAMVAGFAVALGMMGAVVGDVTLMALVQAEGWKWTVLLSSIAGVVLTAVIFLIVRDNPRQLYLNRPKVERRQYAIQFSHVFSALFKTMKRRQVWLNGLISGLLYLPASAFAELWGIPFLQAHGISHAHSAFAVSMVFIGWATGGPIGGFVSDTARCRKLPILFGGLMGALMISILLYAPGLPLPAIYALLFFFGFFSSVQVITFAVGREVSSAKIAGTAIAFTNMLVMAFGALLQPMIGVLLDHQAVGIVMKGVHLYTVHDFQYALSVIPIGMLVAALLTIFMKETHCKLDQSL